MITVQILINGKVVIARSARNIGDVVDNANLSGPMSLDTSRYQCDDGRQIDHLRSSGAVALAIKMLAGVREP